MANPCSPNASVAKTGIGPVVVYDAAKLVNLFAFRGMSWLANYMPQIGGQNYDLPSFCAADRPQPETDPGTILNYFSPINPTGAADQYRWLVDLANMVVWDASCTCSGAGDPTPGPAINQPTGLTISPPNTGPQAGTPCAQGSLFATWSNPGGGGSFQVHPLSTANSLLGKQPTTVVVQDAFGVNSGAFQFTVKYQYIDGSGVAQTLGSHLVSNVQLNNQLLTFALPPGTQDVNANYGGWGGTGTVGDSSTWKVYCGGASPTGTTSSPCCPPDSTLAGLIQQVLDQVNLIQTYRLPFAYVPGATHGSQSGAGSFGVTRLLGVKLSNMTIPASYGTALGNPNYYFDLGWLSILTGDGFIDEVRIHSDGQVWLPNQMQQAVTLGYTFHPGVSADITELEAETL